jgi:hypothetical protein
MKTDTLAIEAAPSLNAGSLLAGDLKNNFSVFGVIV